MEKNQKNNTSIILKIIIILFAILMCFLIYIRIKDGTNTDKISENQKEIIYNLIDKSSAANVTKYEIYGTHFNLEGNYSYIKLSGIKIKSINLIAKNLSGNEISLEANYKTSDNGITFSSSDKINEGLNLEALEIGEYYLFLKIDYSNSETKYISFQNASSYNDLTYYTITKNESNNKIIISFSSFNDIPCMNINVTTSDSLPDDVYDIAIAPAHGGLDKGAQSNGYNEADLVLQYGLNLKEKLEHEGLKVFISRDGTESSKEDTSNNMYSENGEINILNKSHAKIIISLHINNSTYSKTKGGLEIYAPNNCNLDFASELSSNIVTLGNTYNSEYTGYKVQDGIYVKNFTQSDISAFENKAQKGGYAPYNITTSTPYLYIIRETGGISTNAFVDGRNAKYGKNNFWNSNIGSETYQIELAYMYVKSDLDNLIANYDAYMQAITNTIKEFYLK